MVYLITNQETTMLCCYNWYLSNKSKMLHELIGIRHLYLTIIDLIFKLSSILTYKGVGTNALTTRWQWFKLPLHLQSLGWHWTLYWCQHDNNSQANGWRSENQNGPFKVWFMWTVKWQHKLSRFTKCMTSNSSALQTMN